MPEVRVLTQSFQSSLEQHKIHDYLQSFQVIQEYS